MDEDRVSVFENVYISILVAREEPFAGCNKPVIRCIRSKNEDFVNYSMS